MAASFVSIVNAALIELGADTITSLTEDTKAARIANTRLDSLLDATLRAHPWKFAIKRKELAPLVETPEYGFGYQFQLPTSSGDGHCLRLLEIENDDDLYPYRVEGRRILYDSDTLKIKFIQRVTDPTQYDSLFNEVFAARFAVELALGLTGNRELARDMMDLYEKKLREARFVDGTEGSQEDLAADDWINSRL